MSLFQRKEVKKPASFDGLKAKAATLSDAAALEKITGGLLAGCHGGGTISKLAM